MKINRIDFLASLVLVGILFFIVPSVFASNLTGRILLQVEDKGQAWYVNPINNERYYLGRPDDAFNVMRSLGLGASNSDISAFLRQQAPKRLAGRILLQVEDKGQAYYIDPVTLKLNYLGRPADAFNVMRSLGLGITNNDLQKIVISADSFSENNNNQNQLLKNFSFKYRGNNYAVNLNLSRTLYDSYNTSPKVLSYLVSDPPPNLQEAFYNIFLQTKPEDTSINKIIEEIQKIASQNNWYGDWIAEMALALVQYIPYDQAKVETRISNPFYPYETLYLNRGVCSDTTFLAYVILSKLGYGVAIMDFPDINHSALGISCPLEHSINNSGYCYAETTNYFPIGVIPNNISGQASTDDYGFDRMFDESKLGKIEIFNKISGLSYQQVTTVKDKAGELDALYKDLLTSRDNLNTNSAIAEYNKKVDLFNSLLRDFYQK